MKVGDKIRITSGYSGSRDDIVPGHIYTITGFRDSKLKHIFINHPNPDLKEYYILNTEYELYRLPAWF